jgi:lysophospholipid acyltransferase (LPLAT)-like uncharacterized protein
MPSGPEWTDAPAAELPARCALTRRQRWQAGLIAALLAPLVGALGRTWRWHVEGLEQIDAVVASGRQPVMAFWHGRILGATYFFRHRGIVVMTSEHFDGEWMARLIRRFGYGAARGSTTRGGRRALSELVRAMRRGRPAGFAVDGPRGPAGRAQRGAVWLAQVTGNPVVPFHLEAARCWTVPSWDRTQIPKPFSRVALVVGAPIEVPRRADEALLEAKRSELEAALDGLAVRARLMLARVESRPL